MKKTILSGFFLLLISIVSAQTYLMGNSGSISTCSGNFYDSGGNGGTYQINESYTMTFCSSSSQALYLQFTSWGVEAGWDSMYIFDGPTTSDPLIGNYTGNPGPGTVVSTNGSNCLTIVFHSDGSQQLLGWAATIGCGTPPPPPPPPPPPTNVSCALIAPFCSGTSYNFPAATNTTAEVGPDYDCVLTQPNPVWYNLQIATAGNMDITLSNTANVDVDFVCWGPFSSSGACGQLDATHVVDCSYSTAATENINIPNAVVGDYYTLCITNFSNQPTNFTLSSDASSTASTNCLILCNITAMTAVPGNCNPTNNTHDLTGTLTVSYPPSSGTLTITTSTGQSVVVNPPFSSSVNYAIPGLPSTGATISVTAQFSTDTSCHFTTTYSQAPCTCSVIASNNSPVCAGSAVNLTAAITGSITTYQWSGPGGYSDNSQNPVIPNATSAQAGIYSVTVTDGSCTATDTTEVAIQPSTTITSTVQNASCNGASDGKIVVTAAATPPITYVWTGTASTNDTAANLAAGTYSVTVSGGANSCSATANFTITEPTTVVLGTAAITDATCTVGGSISVSASGGTGPIAYLWSTGDSTGGTISNLAAGPYDLTVTDQNGCSTSATYSVSAAPNAITFSAPAITDVSCNAGTDGSITTAASGGTGTISYVWSNGSTTPGINGLAANTYSVTASDVNGCSASVSYLVVEPTPIVFGQPVIVDATCNTGGSITVSASGGTGTIGFDWSNSQTGPMAVNLPAGPYQVTATDQNLCTVTATYTVNPDPNAVYLDIPVVTDISCSGGSDGSITVNATGGDGNYTYSWGTSPAQAGPTATGLAAGPVSVSVSDGNGCSTTQTYTISEPAQIAVTLQHTDATCYQAPNGSITATAIGGTTPYSYLWSDVDNQTTKTAMGLLAGGYTVTVTDNRGCIVSAADVVSEPTDLLINTTATVVKCVGEKNGTISVTATGGTSPYNYSATLDMANFVFATNGIIEGLAVGDYTVIVADNFGCTKTVLATVPNATIDNFTTSTDSTTCYGPNYNDGQVHIADNTLVNEPFQYILDGGISQQSGDFTDVAAGPHTITAINVNGCVSTIPVVVLEPLPIIVDVVPDTVILPLGEGQAVLVTYLNANGEVSYNWTPALGLSCIDCPAPFVSPFTRQDYVVTISTVNGNSTCYGSATLHADVLEPLPVFVPNSFSPNGDGNNDVFMVFGQGIKTIDLNIFNRWGEMVYKTNNQFDGWDGTYKGQLQLPAVFTYAVRVTFLDDKRAEKKGTVTLVR